MTPLNTKYTTQVLGAPRNWNDAEHGPCQGLPIHRDESRMYSWWRVGWRDRLAVLFGKPVRLCIIGAGHPPVSLSVDPSA